VKFLESMRIERKFRKMLLERSGEERLKMGCSMYATAQALAKASISRRYPDAHPAELKRLLFLHFYRTDFEPEKRNRIASAVARSGRADSKVRKLVMNSTIVNSLGADAVRDKTETYGKMGKKKGKRSRRGAR
jgi:hypothetical protein